METELREAYEQLQAALEKARDSAVLVKRCLRQKIVAQAVLKDTEMELIASGADSAGRNAEQRAAIIHQMTTEQRVALRIVEDELLKAEIEQIKAEYNLRIAQSQAELAARLFALCHAEQNH